MADTRKARKRVAGKFLLPDSLKEQIPQGCSPEEYRRHYARMRYWYLKEHDPGFVESNREKTRAAIAKDPETIRQRKLAYCEANRDKEKARAAKWIKENRERGIAARRAYYEAHKEEHRAAQKVWNAANRDKLYAIQHAQRTKGREAGGRFTADDINRIFAAQKGKCALCRKKLGTDKQLDHIHPIHKGGTNHPRNLQWLCALCNQRKSHKDPIDFSRELGLLL